MDYLPTGVPNLDIILGGGLPKSYLVVIGGGPGTGKTVLVQQIANYFAQQGGRVLYVTALSEPHTKLVSHLSGFSFFDRSFLGDRIKIINVFPIAKQGLAAVTAALLRTIKDERIDLLIFDGFRSLRDIHADEREVRVFSYELAGTLSSIRATAVFTSELDLLSEQYAPEVAIADGLIMLRSRSAGLASRSTVEVIKMRGMQPVRGLHSIEITDDGIQVFPRAESISEPTQSTSVGDRASLDVAGLDALLGGGLPNGSSTLVAGEPGSGKTLFCLHFALAGSKVRRTDAVSHLSRVRGGPQRQGDGLGFGFGRGPAH
jgi:circadian clock protein KaiC